MRARVPAREGERRRGRAVEEELLGRQELEAAVERKLCEAKSMMRFSTSCRGREEGEESALWSVSEWS